MNGEIFVKNFLKWVLKGLPFAYMLLVWILSSLPHNAVVELPDSSIDRFFKESMHLVEFAILYLLSVGAVMTTGRFSKGGNLLCAAIAIGYGLLDEYHQSFVPYRSATVIDFVKDTIGVLIAYYFVHRGCVKHGYHRIRQYFAGESK